jgi:cytochrome c peroxidase
MDTNDIVSSQGVRLNDSVRFDPRDPIFNWRGTNVRRVAPRNAQGAINAVFHIDQFWDGRGSFVFNGVTPFGFRDTQSRVKRNVNGTVQDVEVRIPFAAHASQSVGPPLSGREMSGHARNFTDLAVKLLDPALVPLGRQLVHPQDSSLGPYAQATLNRRGQVGGTPGLKTSYAALIQQAFRPEWVTGQFTEVRDGVPVTVNVLERNFPLVFGLSMLMYQATLVADDTPFDRYMGANANVRGGGAPIAADPTALTAEEKRGLELFVNDGKCTACHSLPETSNAVVRLSGTRLVRGNWNDPVNVVVPQTFLELMPMGNNALGVYDLGFYNIGVRPTEEDIGRGNAAPPPAGLTMGWPLSYSELALMKFQGQLPPSVAEFVPDTGKDEAGNVVSLSQLFTAAGNRVVTRGAFKSPTLRNQQYQGPYFHNGESSTLRHVVEFYARGGNFPATNVANLDADIGYIPSLDTSVANTTLAAQADANIRALVAFLSRGLNDERVIQRKAPFDHPQLFIPVGQNPSTKTYDSFVEVTATGGSTGGSAITPFLGLNPQSR